MSQTILQQFLDNSIRIEIMLHLGLQMLDESLPDNIADAFHFDTDNIADALGVVADDLALDVNRGDISWDMRFKYKRQGYLVKFATPIPTSFSDDGETCDRSWESYQCKWIYAESLDECCTAALEWQSQYIGEQKAEFFNSRGEG